MVDSLSNQAVRSNFDPDPQYWCYHCDKRIFIETLANLPDIICFKCKNGYNQFLQVLQLIAQVVSDEDVPLLPPPLSHQNQPKDDFLRIELKGLDNDEDNNDEDNGNGDEHHDLPQLGIQDFMTCGRSGRNRILDWAEILMGLDENTLEFQLKVPELDRYVGNPEDYVDTTGYEALLQNLAESDGSGRRGAPPASKTTSSGLPTMEVRLEEEACALLGILGDEVWVWEMGKVCLLSQKYKEKCLFVN
ncbi:hypothetical protein UlMin_023580 [Ulmus minor]